jgi:hypothetical protein
MTLDCIGCGRRGEHAPSGEVWCAQCGEGVPGGRPMPGQRVRRVDTGADVGSVVEYGVVIASWRDGPAWDCRVAFWASRPEDGVDPGNPYTLRYYATSLAYGWGD